MHTAPGALAPPIRARYAVMANCLVFERPIVKPSVKIFSTPTMLRLGRELRTPAVLDVNRPVNTKSCCNGSHGEDDVGSAMPWAPPRGRTPRPSPPSTRTSPAGNSLSETRAMGEQNASRPRYLCGRPTRSSWSGPSGRHQTSSSGHRCPIQQVMARSDTVRSQRALAHPGTELHIRNSAHSDISTAAAAGWTRPVRAVSTRDPAANFVTRFAKAVTLLTFACTAPVPTTPWEPG